MMKKLAVLCVGLIATSLSADSTILFMDSQKLMQESKEGQALVIAASKRRDELIARVQSWQEELKSKAETLDKQRALLAPEVVAEKEQELGRKSNEYTRQGKALEESWQEEIRAQQMKLFEKLKKVSAEVCKKENGYALLDTGMPGVYFVNPKLDITKNVIEAADTQYLKEQAAAAAKN